jgi:hypothetical protein
MQYVEPAAALIVTAFWVVPAQAAGVPASSLQAICVPVPLGHEVVSYTDTTVSKPLPHVVMVRGADSVATYLNHTLGVLFELPHEAEPSMVASVVEPV